MLRGYQGEDIEIQLPGDLTVHDIDWLSVWCISFRENFGHVIVPRGLDVPPALGQNQLTVSWYKKSIQFPSFHPTTKHKTLEREFQILLLFFW